MTTEHHKKSRKQKIFDAIPKSLDHNKLLQNAIGLLLEVQKQATDLKEDTNDEINKLLKKVKGSYQEIGSKAKENVATLVQTWHDEKSHLPKKFTGEVDRLLDRVGLVRKAKTKEKAKTKPKSKTQTASKPKTSAKKPAVMKTKTGTKPSVKKPVSKSSSSTGNSSIENKP